MRILAALLGLATFVPAAPAAEGSATEPPVELSPFQVTTAKDTGYIAGSSLAGTRLNTELRDTPAAISVFNREFLADIGAQNLTEALNYTLNGGRNVTDFVGTNFLQYDVLVQVRGYVGASLVRDYFNTSTSGDGFNFERLDFARGPNSILFGIGGPGGAVNRTPKRARLDRPAREVQAVARSWADVRTTIDLNQPLGGNGAVRANAVHQDRQSWREFEHELLRGGALAAVWRPFRRSQLRFDGEYLDRTRVAALPWSAGDYVTPWVRAGRPLAPNNATNVGTGLMEQLATAGPVYDPANPAGPMSWAGTRITSAATLASPSSVNNRAALTDFSLMPRSAWLGGPGYTSDSHEYNASLFFEQKLGRFTAEIAFNRAAETRRVFQCPTLAELVLRADPNPLLPARIGADGKLPAGAGQPNPNAGRLFVQGTTNRVDSGRRFDNGRATFAYPFDPPAHRPWLGHHQLAGLLSRSTSDQYSDTLPEVNIAPAGNAQAPLDLTNGLNRITRRTYLDFSSADPRGRGAHDPRQYPLLNQNGVTSGFARVTETAWNNVRSTTDSAMLASQSSFWAGRVIVTAGLRRDHQDSQTSLLAPAAPRVPVANTFNRRDVNQSPGFGAAGNTRTLGLVFHATPGLSLFANDSNNFSPVSNTFDAQGQPFPARLGTGRDLGLRLALPDHRLTLTVNRYRMAERNRPTGANNDLAVRINAIWTALDRPDLFFPNASQDTADSIGDGWETELTANPTRFWRLSLNLSRSRIEQSNTMPRNGAYLAAHRATWEAGASTPLVNPPAPFSGTSRVRDAITEIDRLYATYLLSNGTLPRLHRTHAANLFTTYQISSGPAWLRGVTVGGGVNYRGPWVVGYDPLRANAPLLDGGYTLFNASLARNFKLRPRVNLRLQCNVDNLFDADALIVTDADQTTLYRFMFQQPRRFGVTATLGF